MKYNRAQKFLSYFLIFSLLFWITFRVPFIDFWVKAASNDIFSLVSIIVDEKTYKETEYEIKRYSRDISSTLENTKVIILPVPDDVTPFSIASMNEGLYFDWYKTLSSVWYESKLIWTVLVWNIPLPEVYIENQSSRTILPYTDFLDKSYIYNSDTWRYEQNSSNEDWLKAEIWHWVISPNLWSNEENIQAIKDYFDKNHNFYIWEWQFDSSAWSINWNTEDLVNEDYEPFVFYYDWLRENKALNYWNYIWYKAYLDNKEDLIYNRFTKWLANKISSQVNWYNEGELLSLVWEIAPDLLLDYQDSSESFASATDIQNRYVINNSIKKFVEIFAPASIWELREDVYNAWRYNYWQNVNVDFLSYLITVLDVVNDEIIKEINTELENEIDNAVKNWPYRNIALPVSYSNSDTLWKSFVYTNYLNWVKARDIEEVAECSIYRGSTENNWQLTYMLSAFDFSTMDNNWGTKLENEMDLLLNIDENKNDRNKTCLSLVSSGESLRIWWWNSALNLDMQNNNENLYTLKYSDPKNAILPIFDYNLIGAIKADEQDKILSAYSCLDNNYLKSLTRESICSGSDDSWEYDCEIVTTYILPWSEEDIKNYGYRVDNSYRYWNYNRINEWTCNTDNRKDYYDFSWTFDQKFNEFYLNTDEYKRQNNINNIWLFWNSWDPRVPTCIDYVITLDWVEVRKLEWNRPIKRDSGDEYSSQIDCNTITTHKWDYKSIPSYSIHKSPTASELWAQVQAMISPNLPIDKDRYIDFISQNAEYQKINYPYLFRLKLENETEITLEKTKEYLDNYLDSKSSEINEIFTNSYNNNEWERELWLISKPLINELLNNDNATIRSIDLKEYLKSKDSAEIDIHWTKKEITNYDTLAFAIFWNNLGSISAKYKYIFENYLSSQSSNGENYFLPKNKSLYEIAYLVSNGNSDSMYIWLDPEGQAENPYSDIILANQNISSQILGLNTWSNFENSSNSNKCYKPEGVPIWEWFPAVQCRLEDMMPPTISISDGQCWPSLSDMFETEDEYKNYQEEYLQCNWDFDKNWINDCIENSLKNWRLTLSSSSNKYPYNSYIDLNAKFETTDWKDLLLANNVAINFELEKVEKINSSWNSELVYDKNNNNFNNKNLYKNLLQFNNVSISSLNWGASYQASVSSSDLNLYFRVNTQVKDNNWDIKIDLKSDLLEIFVREETLYLQTQKLTGEDNTLWVTNVKASEKVNIFLLDWYINSLDSVSNAIKSSSNSQEKLVVSFDIQWKNNKVRSLTYPVKVSLLKNWLERESLIISDKINSYIPLYSLKESWEYTLQVIDSEGLTNHISINVLPWEAERLEVNLGSNIISKWGITTNFVTILDEYDNVVTWDFLDLNFQLNWEWLYFQDNFATNLKVTTFEWYNIFRLKTTEKLWNNTLKVSLLDENGNEMLSDIKNISVIDNYSIDFIPQLNIKVWGEEAEVDVIFKDNNWNILTNLNSRVYTTISANYVNLEKEYFDVIAWKATIKFKTKNIAGANIPLELQLEWMVETINKTLTILPELPVKMDLILSNSKIEAKNWAYSELQVELKDRYNNLVFNDNNTRLSLDILENYTHIIWSNSDEESVSWWKARFRIYWTANPWIWYFKVSSNPNLSINKIILEDDNWQTQINWVWENAWSIETFYMWNKEKIDNIEYNSLYTTLLWSNYWDIEQKNYLAWSLIFNKNNKALAVTSLLNNPYLQNNTISISNNGRLKELLSGALLDQSISKTIWLFNWKIFFDYFNISLNAHIWKIVYNLPKNPNYQVCTSTTSCINQNQTSIFWLNTSENYKFYIDSWELILADNTWKILLNLDKDWIIQRKDNISFDLVDNESQSLLLNIIYWNEVIASLGFNFIDSDLSVTRDERSFQNRVSSWNNSIIIFLDSLFYWYYTKWKQENLDIIIYYNDPFSSSSSLNSFTNSQFFAYENFMNQDWLWWKDWNKSLLSFSAWESVWESTRKYASFWTINIWDPVISLESIQKKFNNSEEYKKFDSSIWKIISDTKWLLWYRIFDYNNDERSDILLLKDDGKFELLEKLQNWDEYISLWDLAYIYDLWNIDNVKTWDFTWDWFDDIFFVWTDWNPYLLNNINKDFSRLSLLNKIDLKWNIIRAEVFDMDWDSKDDIVILDSFWEINIFYWYGSSSNPNFEKLTLTSDYGVELSDSVINTDSAIYFDWLHQISSDSYIIWEDDLDYNLFNSYIFEQIPYSQENTSIDDIWNYQEELSFIKSDYSSVVDLIVEKRYIDRNWEKINSWDPVDAEIIIKNVWNTRKNNIIFLDKIPSFINEDLSSIQNSLDKEIKTTNSSYDFMIDWFSLAPWQTMKITYSGVMRKISYLDIQVGLFEWGEIWDDNYWDVIIRTNEKSCWETVDIFRSVSVRYYEKWKKEAICDNSELPEWLRWPNGWTIYDHIISIEELLWKDTSSLNNEEKAIIQNEQQNYSKNVLSWILKDSDWDWIPDDEDYFSYESWQLTIGLWKIWENMEKWLDNIQNIINWLSCWFNNWACYSTPLNWAPLAPWNDPTFMWYLAGDWLRVSEWYPIFSALTWYQTMCWLAPCCQPIVFPASPMWYLPWPVCMPLWAWGYLWTTNLYNFFRLFVTPTLTGAVWVAMCFWWAAEVFWNSNPIWVHPVVPGGNCIVITKPIAWCSNDWSGGNPLSQWIPQYSSDWYALVNANCWTDISSSTSTLKSDYVKDYYNFVSGYSWLGHSTPNFVKWAFEDHTTYRWEALFQINWAWTPVEISFDNENKSIDYSDIKKISLKRPNSFPGFIMNWINAQIEEIVTKLTDFPSIFVILPDFSWIFDSFKTLPERKNELFKSLNKNSYDWLNKDTLKSIDSWIKEVYEFVASVPLVNVNQDTINISIPWISKAEINKVIDNRKNTLGIRKEEIKEAKEKWSLWTSCNYEANSEEQKICEEQNSIWEKLLLWADGLLRSLEKNLSVLEDYKNTPEKINKLITKKEDYLEQVLCNIESISEITWGRISKNWKIFKTWVELYILIKSILKSWQLIIDIFFDFEASCSDCKNERQDLIWFLFRLISFVVPDIPIIKFPKWPDIVLDLHNIRAGLDITLPEFNITTRPILLPSLPRLSLPDTPSWSLQLPELDILPTMEIPDLPDLPSLPSIELPDLPPAPSLPKLLWEIDIVLDIARILTKAMCILKTSPFVPEWRAWDQIAYLTERNWYLPFDFLDLNMPQFTYPYVDAIQVGSFVNLERETDYIIELARQIALPITSMNSDFTNIFNISISDLDFSWATPSDINLEIDSQWDLNSDLSLNSNEVLWWKKLNIVTLLWLIVWKAINDELDKLNNAQNELVTSKEIRKQIGEYFNQKEVASNPKYDELRELWNTYDSYTFAYEDNLINTLQKENADKFATLKDIINTEKIKNQKLKETFNKSLESWVVKVSLNSWSIDIYNTALDRYNKSTIEKYNNLIWETNSWLKQNRELKSMWENVLAKTNSYTSSIEKNNLLASTTDISSNTTNTNIQNNQATCSAWAWTWNWNWDYSYNYEWLYIVENANSYRLFDYKKELNWDEKMTLKDIDLDWDEDILYMMNWVLYLKENLSIKDTKRKQVEEPIVVSSNYNKFLKNNFIESVNNFKSSITSNWLINLSFIWINNVNNYRLSYYDIVDKFNNETNISYIPKYKKKTIIDAVSWIWEVNILNEDTLFNENNDLVYIETIWDTKDVELYTDELINIKDDLNKWLTVTVWNWSALYAWNSVTTMKYMANNETRTLIIPKNRHIVLKWQINIIWLTWDLYIRSGEKITLKWPDIRKMQGMPLFPWSKISYTWNDTETNEKSYIYLTYYDGSKYSIDFNIDKSWELYDLWVLNENRYTIVKTEQNNFYYAKINSFKDNIVSTSSQQELLAPQIQAENFVKDLRITWIRIPVYQKQSFLLNDLVDINDLSWIKEVEIIFDLENNSDSTSTNNISVRKEWDNFVLEFAPFEELINKKIGISLKDINWNSALKEIWLEVYTPIPSIINIEENTITWNIEENLTNEPINIYRLRWGQLSLLNEENILTNDWEYQFWIEDENLFWLKIEKNWDLIARVNEYTWKINLLKSNLRIYVSSSNEVWNNSSYPLIQILEWNNVIYNQSIKSNSNNFEIVNNFDNALKNSSSWVYIKLLNSWNYSYNSNDSGIFISRNTSTNNEHLFVITKDGRINTLNERYIIEYDSLDDYILLKLIDGHFNREVANVLYKLQWDYVIQ